MIPNNAANEIEALEKLVTLSRFATNRTVRLEEIQRQLAKANAMVVGGYFANRRESAPFMQLCDSHDAGRQGPAIGRSSRRWGAPRAPASAGGGLGEGVRR
jgi:hypothetical protein